MDSAVSDRDWLVPVAVVTGIEFSVWAGAYSLGLAARPMLASYGLLSTAFFAFVVGSWLLAVLWRERPERPLSRIIELISANKVRILEAIIGCELFALSSAAIGSLKEAIPAINPFWFDLPLAHLEAGLWAGLYSLLWWAVPFFDRLYGTFVLTHVLAVLGLLCAKPSDLKTKALISLALAWFFLALVSALLLSSAGPAFFDRVYGVDTFAPLDAALSAHAPLTLMTIDALWRAHQSGVPMVGNGISAMPSMHVALTLWLALVLKSTRIAPIVWAYYALIWTGSVLLGWHWFCDGLAGSAGMLVCWKLARPFSINLRILEPLRQ
jgi:hypothetical protein